MAGVAADVTEQKLAEERLLRMAHSDALTNLPNRRLFYDSLTRTLEHAREHHWIVGVLFVDLDRFKVVNDTLGHATGDELLRQVAERLTDCVRIRDLVGRLGGDEFGVLLLLDDPNEACAAAEKILHALVEPFTLEGREAFVSASIGITIYPTDATDPDTLLRYADTAMYRAKDDGRNVCRYYTAEMNARAAERLDLETDLRRALSQHEFLLDYQPKLDLATGAISGIEALLRWRRPGGVGLAPPADFMPLLEETGLIVPVGEWVIGEVCRQLRAWQHDGVQAVPIAVNLSARQFHDENLPDKVMQSVREHGVSSELLEFEITESSAMSSADQTAGILDVLRAAGARIAIDDFGTGYSSLTYLKRFPIDVIKIDGAFVRDVTTDADDAAIVLAIIGMAHQLGLRVVAEGVETVDQMSFLNAHGCDEIQGDVFSKPMDATKIAELLRGDLSTARWEAAGAR
jgi:diguanylate cyclase (GGDEF)-like protein